MDYDIKDYIKGNVQFVYYKNKELFYITENGLTFPVPIDDIGSAEFKASDKALYFMRYIRKYLESLKSEEK